MITSGASCFPRIRGPFEFSSFENCLPVAFARFFFLFLFVAGTEYFRVVGVVESEVAISHGLRWVIIVTVFTSA